MRPPVIHCARCGRRVDQVRVYWLPFKRAWQVTALCHGARDVATVSEEMASFLGPDAFRTATVFRDEEAAALPLVPLKLPAP